MTETNPAKIHVRKELEVRALDNAGFNAKVRELEAAGHKIVDDGQTGPYDDAGNAPWRVVDWRTREVLASGTTEASFEEAHAKLDPDDRWYHVDNVWNNAPLTEPSPTEGLPASLATALEEWVGSTAAPEEIAEWIGWSIDKVKQCLAERPDTDA